MLGNDGNEIRTIEQSAVATIASRLIAPRISPSDPEKHTPNKRSELLFVPLGGAIQTYGLGDRKSMFVERTRTVAASADAGISAVECGSKSRSSRAIAGAWIKGGIL